MVEEIKLDGNIFGYDTLIKDGSNFVALRGEDVPELYTGMDVVLLGDSRGYVPSWFNPGEEVTIVGFRESFKNGNSDHIIKVANKRNEGWVKPSNIQKNIAEQKNVDSNYRRIRRSVHVAFVDFMDNVYLHMTDDERSKLPNETYPFVNKIITYALQNLTEFDELLAKTITRLYVESPSGERFIQDPVRTNPITKSILYLDGEGNLVTVKNPEIVWSTDRIPYMFMKKYESYEVLNGLLAGKSFYSNDRPLGDPLYHPGKVTEANSKLLESQNNSDRLDGVNKLPSSDGKTSSSIRASDKEKTINKHEIFISYSHRDRKWLERVQVHLKPLVRDHNFILWDDTQIKAGTKWKQEIIKAIRNAKVAVLLVSADFMASDFISSNELPPILANAKENGTIILPIILSASWFSEDENLSQYQAANDPAKPLNKLSRPKQEEVLNSVSKTISSYFR